MLLTNPTRCTPLTFILKNTKNCVMLAALLFAASGSTAWAADCVSGAPLSSVSTCTLPVGVTSVKIEAWGGGGGGSAGSNGGGGGGSYCAATFTGLPALAVLDIIAIGSGGLVGGNSGGGDAYVTINSTFALGAWSGLDADASSPYTPGGGGARAVALLQVSRKVVVSLIREVTATLAVAVAVLGVLWRTVLTRQALRVVQPVGVIPAWRVLHPVVAVGRVPQEASLGWYSHFRRTHPHPHPQPQHQSLRFPPCPNGA